jgi:cytochrome b561
MANMQPSTPWRYSTPAIVLHWVLAALIVFMACLGWYMMTVERQPSGPGLFALHRSIGLIVFTLVLLRVLWRVFHKPEPLPAGVPPWQAKLSHIVQWLLYVAMLALPITGILGSGHTKAGIAFFGAALPRWTAPDHDTAEQFFGWHSTLVWITVGLLVLHVLGGLKHLFVDRDKVFARMWPARRRA